ncbi:MAG: Zn-ribbon domain-containing OB-fold protein [Syntrophales bacterium]|nr:Zn-ribbon domain-containing OB-fold protein [Syntrophales bacterium]MDP3096386.1 Zn-ribbon domain-containing OB-fold protein [Syntrophales bacterium]
MSTDNVQVERLESVFSCPMPYEWSIGLYGSRFFQEIKQNRRFVGIRCKGCGKVYVPPRRVCGPCFEELTELVTLSDTGVITAFSVVNYPFIDPNTGSQRPIPYTYGYIKLDGADNIFSNIINETDLSKIKVGMKVRAVFKDAAEMEGNIQDIKYFDILG